MSVVTPSEKSYDVIVIGGGHNGLIAAAYLAKAGRHVVVLEASDRLGGAAAGGDLVSDYLVPTLAHLVEALPRRIERELRLRRHGLRYAVHNLATIVLDQNGGHLDLTRTRKAIRTLAEANPVDAIALRLFRRQIDACVTLLAPLLSVRLDDEKTSMDSVLHRLFQLPFTPEKTSAATLVQMLPASIGDWLDAHISSDAFKAAIAFDATLGTDMGPYEPGTLFHYIYREAMRAQGHGLALPRGGTGGLVAALASAATHYGVDLRLNAHVAHILVEFGVVQGVEMKNGTRIQADVVLSSIDPVTTMLDLAGSVHIDAGMAKHLSRITSRGASAKVNFALNGLPGFANLTREGHSARILILSSLSALDRSFVWAKRGMLADELTMEVLVPSLQDTSFAPEGHHVMSVIVQHVPRQMPGGWEMWRDELVRRVIATISLYAPNIERKIVATEALTPTDIEEKFGLRGGGWHHGDMKPDQLLMFRPAPSLANYTTSIEGLYLCGAGSHPGGGISGLPGKLAAQTVLLERKRS